MAWVDLGGWVSALVSIICCVYVYGKLAQNVADNSRWRSTAESQLIDHERRIGRLEGRSH